MPVITRSLHPTCILPRPLLILSRHLSTTPHLSQRDSQFRRSDFSSQGFTGQYEPGGPTVGPLGQASRHGAPRLTPRMLKEHLDKFVVGQDKAKKVTSVAIYNHYQRIRELKRQEAEEQERKAQKERRLLAERERNSHPLENEFPGHIESVDLNYRAPYPPPHSFSPPEPELGSSPLTLPSHDPIIEKSNLLLLGPSGVGKTYIIKTLASVLEVPFATVDCSSLTQAGYIGTDIESSIERLLSASNNNIEKCESGIIFFDEVDKLAKPAIMTHGRDVSGEGVQQGLLKMIEGTTITVNSKSDRNAKSESQSRGSDRLDRGGREGLGAAGQGAKSEQYTIDTSNILFIFAGAFIGLERIITSRLSSGSSIGFGASLKALPPTPTPSSTPSTPLDSVTAQDLQTYGLIPELLGRIPILTSLSPLYLTQLVSILTEPQNSLVKQFTSLLGTSGIQLKFSTGAIHAIAERALDGSSHSQGSGMDKGKSSGGIGARGLRSIMEEVLHEIMYHGPGSGIRYCLVDEKFVRGSTTETSQFSSHSHSQSREHGGEEKSLMPLCWSRGQGRLFEEAWDKEEESWRRKEEEKERKERKERGEEEQPPATFERLRSVGRSGM